VLKALGEIDFSGLSDRLLPQLVHVLSHRDAAARTMAARALCQIGPRAKAALPTLLKALHDKEDQVRLWSLAALANMGPGARRAVPELSPLLMDGDLRIREAAQRTLLAVEPDLAARTDQ
jgi:HEAT repeat protein